VPRLSQACRVEVGITDLRSQTWGRLRSWDRRIEVYVSAGPGFPRKRDRGFPTNMAHDKGLGSSFSSLRLVNFGKKRRSKK